jgi:hypothetical protein
MRASQAVVMSMVVSGCTCGGVAVSDLPSNAASTVCGKIYTCCTADEAKPTNFGPDEATCEKNVKNNFDSSSLSKSESAGRIVYHADLAADCLAQYQAKSCEDLKSNASSDISSCDKMIEAKVQVGGACSDSRECVGSTCAGASSGVDGVCTSFLTENSSCADGGVCGSGLFCDVASKSCAATKTDGASCNANYECSTGGCNGRDAGVSGTCGLKGGAGTTCYATQGCSATGAAPLGLVVLAVFARARARRSRQGAQTPSAGS